MSEGQSYALGTPLVGGNVNVVSATGQDITAVVTGGSLGGILQARDQDLPQVASALDHCTYAIVDAVNNQNEQGVDANGARVARSSRSYESGVNGGINRCCHHGSECNCCRRYGRRVERQYQCDGAEWA